MLKKCFIVFCFIIFVYGDENATNSASSGVNSSANALNLAANATENQNAQSNKILGVGGENLSTNSKSSADMKKSQGAENANKNSENLAINAENSSISQKNGENLNINAVKSGENQSAQSQSVGNLKSTQSTENSSDKNTQNIKNAKNSSNINNTSNEKAQNSSNVSDKNAQNSSNENAQSAKNLSDKSANNSSDENAQISSDTNDASNENAQNSNDINDESAKNSSDTNDESDFSFDDFEAEFAAPKVNDPLSGYNKMMTRFNVALYTYVLRPVAKGYEFIMPEFARLGIKNFFSYIAMPIRFTGNVLQFKFKEAGTELKRFGVNTIFGFFGLIDAASNAGIPLYHSDFGLVLAHWGVGGGFHFVLPVLGPSNLRDTLSIPVNWYASPITYVATYDTSAWINWLSVGITSFGIINSVSFETQTLDAIYYNTPNLYPFMRDAYEKRRTEMAK